jgi:hypothetical protein
MAAQPRPRHVRSYQATGQNIHQIAAVAALWKMNNTRSKSSSRKLRRGATLFPIEPVGVQLILPQLPKGLLFALQYLDILGDQRRLTFPKQVYLTTQLLVLIPVLPGSGGIRPHYRSTMQTRSPSRHPKMRASKAGASLISSSRGDGLLPAPSLLLEGGLGFGGELLAAGRTTACGTWRSNGRYHGSNGRYLLGNRRYGLFNPDHRSSSVIRRCMVPGKSPPGPISLGTSEKTPPTPCCWDSLGKDTRSPPWDSISGSWMGPVAFKGVAGGVPSSWGIPVPLPLPVSWEREACGVCPDTAIACLSL